MKYLCIALFVGLMSIDGIAGDTLAGFHYLLRNPGLKTAKPPVLILLHGYGSNEEDLYSFADQLPSKYMVFSLRAPQKIADESFKWYSLDIVNGRQKFNFKEEEESRRRLIQFIEKISRKYTIDPAEIYLCGFSQGAIMCYSLALTKPELVAGIAVLSGKLLEEIKPEISHSKKLKSMKIFISHGSLDNVIPVANAREAQTYLKSVHLSPVYKEYNVKHEICLANLRDLIQWLNK